MFHRPPHLPPIGPADVANAKVLFGRDFPTSHQSLPANLRPTGRDRWLYGVHSVDISAAEHGAWRAALGGSYGGGISRDAGHRTHLPHQFRKRAIELGHTGTESLPARPALWRE